MDGSSVGSLVREHAVSVDRAESVSSAIDAVSAYTPTDDGVSVYYVYITDGETLVGVVSLRELLNAEDADPVSEIMTTDPVAVSTTDSLDRTIRKIIDHRFAVVPVVDDADRLVGIVLANDVIDALDERTTKQLFKQAGLWMR